MSNARINEMTMKITSLSNKLPIIDDGTCLLAQPPHGLGGGCIRQLISENTRMTMASY